MTTNLEGDSQGATPRLQDAMGEPDQRDESD